ncbi:MAG TPA: GNAT family N-acetyltransferase [Rhizomicrobium sp.]|jgi:GNAT superfamily N-acetyltransferase|nr:GNAT family N-acetyltransferase [Rhizomicrobium sp.]
MNDFSIRRARLGDEAAVLALLIELAEYEKLMPHFKITLDVIRRDYLSAQPLIHCDLALEGGTPVGVMSWYWIYSSFAAKRAIYLEDLFVRPACRGRGYGLALLKHLAATAVAADAQRIDWAVLDWNKPSIDFYDALGAHPHDGWFDYRLEGEALKKLGGG